MSQSMVTHPKWRKIGDQKVRFAAALQVFDGICVSDCEGGFTLRATRTIDTADPHLRAHFPDAWIFPGVFMIEGLQQAIASAVGELEDFVPELLMLRSVRFLAPALPGDIMTMSAIVSSISQGKPFEVDAQFTVVDGTTVAKMKAEFGFRETPDA